MADPAVRPSLRELAERFGLALSGDADAAIDGMIDGIGTLAGAGPTQLTFLANPAYRRQLAGTRAGAVVLREADAAKCPLPAFDAVEPYAAFAKIAALFEPPSHGSSGVHSTAVVDATASVDPTAAIGPLACIRARSRIG